MVDSLAARLNREISSLSREIASGSVTSSFCRLLEAHFIALANVSNIPANLSAPLNSFGADTSEILSVVHANLQVRGASLQSRILGVIDVNFEDAFRRVSLWVRERVRF